MLCNPSTFAPITAFAVHHMLLCSATFLTTMLCLLSMHLLFPIYLLSDHVHLLWSMLMCSATFVTIGYRGYCPCTCSATPFHLLSDHVHLLCSMLMNSAIPYSKLCIMFFAHALALLPIQLLSDHVHLLCFIFTCLTTLFTALLPCPLSMHLLCYLFTCSAIIMAFPLLYAHLSYYLIHSFVTVSILHTSAQTALLPITDAYAVCSVLLTYIHFLSNYGFICSALSQLICSTAHSTVHFHLALPCVRLLCYQFFRSIATGFTF
jgi:hypothetical protein